MPWKDEIEDVYVFRKSVRTEFGVELSDAQLPYSTTFCEHACLKLASSPILHSLWEHTASDEVMEKLLIVVVSSTSVHNALPVY
jgi:hypothetical protein